MASPVSAQLLRDLALADSLQAEAIAPNNILPRQPGLVEIAGNQPAQFVAWLANEVQSGLRTSPATVVTARKPRHGTRPAPIWAIPDRVTYRALVDKALQAEPPLRRSPEDYEQFEHGPIDYVMEHGPAAGTQPFRTIGSLVNNEAIRYVVKSDLTAFYEYVDHGILGRLLTGRPADVQIVRALVELIQDVEGRTYGLPQMFAGSDRLSEVYGQFIEDQLLRRGMLVWRFNDDFRIAVPNFTAAINAIEALSEEARALGLVINEQKTTTPGLISYAFRVFGLNAATDLLPVEAVEEPEVLVSDYADLPADTEEAAGVLNAAVSADASPSLAELSVDDIRNLRRALWTLVRSKDPAALELIRPFSIYVPSLTPLLCRYFWVLSEDYSADVAAQIDSVIQNVSLGGWQRLWFNYLLYKTGFLGDGTPGDLPGRVSFAKACSSDASHPATRAEAMLALASGHRVGIGAVADSLIAEPRALSSWYVTAAALAAATDQDEKVLGGISGSDPFFGILLKAVR